MEDGRTTLLLIAVIREQDQDLVARAVERLQLPVVCLASIGGFLSCRSTTLLVGVEKGREAEVLKALEQSTRQCLEYLILRLEGSPLHMLTPIPVTVSGATIFALPVEYFEEI